jgi:hypothetical protein
MEAWMTVDPTDDGGFVMEVDRADGLSLTATVRLADGRPWCHDLKLRSSEAAIDRALLQTLGLATLLRRAAHAAATPVVRIPVGKQSGLTDAFLEQAAATYRQFVKDRKNKAPARKDDPKTTAAAVARLGRERVEQGYDDAPLSTARRWIQAARARGFLEPTTKGRKGG